MKKLLLIVLLIFIPACRSANDVSRVRQVNPAELPVIDYGNGVYYFPATEANFANNLSAFLYNHPELELVSVTGDGTDVHGRDAGYFVVFRKKKND